MYPSNLFQDTRQRVLLESEKLNMDSMTTAPLNSSPLGPNQDRVKFVPPHVGRHVLPNSPLFAKLLRHARRNRLAIRDNTLKVEKTYGDLLVDVLAYRAFLESSLSPQTLEQAERDEEVYIGVLAAGGYEFTVAILAVHAIGAAAIPMSIWSPT